MNGLQIYSEISLWDVALNFSPSGNITRIMRLRSLADFYTQIVLRTTSHNPDVIGNINFICRALKVCAIKKERNKSVRQFN